MSSDSFAIISLLCLATFLLMIPCRTCSLYRTYREQTNKK